MTRLARPLLVVLVSLIPLAAAWAEPEVAQGIDFKAEVERLRGYQAGQKIGSQLLNAISRSLTELLWLDRLTVSGGRIGIDGRALNTNAIANFIENLDKLPELTQPVLQSVSQQPNRTYKFTIQLGALPARNKASKAEL